MSATRPLYWSVRRELWENRSIYIAPLAVAAVISVRLPDQPFIGRADKMRLPLWRSTDAQHRNARAPSVRLRGRFDHGDHSDRRVFYCLDALHGERRDRSILFWKSLPVSDLTTVLAKASIPLVILPLLTFALTVATQLIMLLLSTVY
jgi:ABC-2 type transport system permease protein